MLSSLQIENVAVIQKAEVHFKPGLNVLTGETGAGKSILIDSINAILGNRTSKDLVRTGASKAVIRAAFEEVPGTVLDSLEKAGYERSDALMLSREITAEGKSTCRINGMPATAAVLRELCGGLININGQHDSVGLLNPARHLGILDDYAQNSAEFQDYYVLYRELVRIKRELDAMITDEAEKQRRIDLLSYQVQEIEDAGLTAGEEQTLESRRKILANASAIRDKIAQSYALLSGDDEASGAVDLLGEASNAVDAAAQLDDALAGASSQLLDLYYNAKDVAADLIGRLDSYDTNDAELDEIDKIAGRRGGSGPDVSREGVQRDILPIVEGSTVNTKYGPVKTDYMLFIAAGAFHVAKVSDLIPELQGRFPVHVQLKSLTREDFQRILTQPDNALTLQYKALLAVDKVMLTFEDSAIEAIANAAFTANETAEDIGARRLHAVFEQVLEDISFNAGDENMPPFELTINGEYVQQHLSGENKPTDLRKYIL